MKKLAIIGLLFGLLLVGAIPNGLSASDHRYVSEWGGYSMSNDGEFFRPQYVAIDDDGNVYVTDLSSRVQKFTSDGAFLKSWGSMGPEDGLFGSPSGIAVFGDHVYVADKKQHSIDVFDKDGNFIFSWGEFGSGDGQFSKPHGVKINSDGIVFVADPGNHRIQKFTSDGEFLSAFGNFGTSNGKLKTPIQLAFHEDSVYVADPGNLKIEKYTDEGIFLKTIDRSFAGSKIRSYDIVINSDGDIYVTDVQQHRIVKISSDGSKTLKSFGYAGSEKNQFLEPIGIAIDAKGYLLVVDSIKNRIVKFETPISKQIEEALTAEQVEKLKELSYTEESENKDTESVDQATETTEQVTEPEQQFVHDTTKPLLQVPNDLVIESTGRFTQVDIGEAMAMDDNGIRLLINNSPKSFSLGIYQIIWTAVDNSGNSAFAIQEIHVVDTLPPVISQIQDKTLEAAVPIKNIVQLQAPSATDVSGVVSILSDAPEFFSIGETIVTWTATDVAGNESSIEQKVTIVDTTSPSLQIPVDIEIEATSFDQNTIDLGDATATDNGEIISITNNAPEFFGVGSTEVIWSVIDSSGNLSSASQVVSIIDTTVPIITSSNDITLEAISIDENIADLIPPSVYDIHDTFITNNAPEFFPIGETIVTWTATDVAGNESSIEQKVTIVDTTSPSLQIPDQKTVEATSLQNTLVENGEAYADDISGISSITNNVPEVFSLGTTLVTWTAVDNYGNTAIYDQTITVVDTTTPSIFIPNDIFSEAVDPILNYIDIGQASGFDSTSAVSISNDMPISFPFGSTTVTWTAVDDSGNVSTDTQTVTIVDTTVPEILSPSDIVVEATGNFVTDIELGLAIIDDIIEVNTVTNDAPDSFPLGETIVTWTATDSSGNFATSTQTVSVVDTTAPSITVPSAIQVEATGIEGNLADIGTSTASDSVEIISIINDAPDSFPLGETTVTWTATDSSGNFATSTQTVSVVDTTSPTLTIPENIIVDSFTLEKLVVIGEAYAFDSVDTLPILTNDAPEAFPLGSTIVTWSVIDQFGNSASLQQTVSVQACGQSISYYNQIMGTTEDDVLMGTNTADLIFAFGGNDMIMGGAGNDCIIGGEGDDIIFGNEGNDHLVGGEGTDIIKGNSGDDKLTGGFGYDILDGGDDFDISYDSISDIVIKCEEQL